MTDALHKFKNVIILVKNFKKRNFRAKSFLNMSLFRMSTDNACKVIRWKSSF